MAESEKNVYVLDLSAPEFAGARHTADTDSTAGIRPVALTDAEALAELMLEAYRGTIDYEGEEIEEAREAIADFFSNAPLLDASMIAVINGAAVSAVLVMSLDVAPFISYVISHPAHKRNGLAHQVVTAACQRLLDAGQNEVRFAITNGNLASEALFGKLGAVQLQA